MLYHEEKLTGDFARFHFLPFLFGTNICHLYLVNFHRTGCTLFSTRAWINVRNESRSFSQTEANWYQAWRGAIPGPERVFNMELKCKKIL